MVNKNRPERPMGKEIFRHTKTTNKGKQGRKNQWLKNS